MNSGRLHFLPAKPLEDPVTLHEAYARAVHGVPLIRGGIDQLLLLGTRERRTEAFVREIAILSALRLGLLHSHIEDPATGAFLRVPPQYWARCERLEGAEELKPVDNATGYSNHMAGQPILVERAKIPTWTACATSFDPAVADLARRLFAEMEAALESPVDGDTEDSGVEDHADRRSAAQKACDAYLEKRLAEYEQDKTTGERFAPPPINDIIGAVKAAGFPAPPYNTVRDWRRQWASGSDRKGRVRLQTRNRSA